MKEKNVKRPFPYVALCLIVVAVLIVTVLVFTILDSTGLIGRWSTAAESDNFKVTENEVGVYGYEVVLQELYYSYYQQYYSNILSGSSSSAADPYTSTLQAMSYYAQSFGSDFFKESGYAAAQSYLAFCEGAKANNVTLDDEDEKAIDDYIAGLEETAKNFKLTVKDFYSRFMGTGVSESDVRSAREKVVLADKYAEKQYDEYSDAVTEDELKDYRDDKDNMGNFYKSKYHSYQLVNESLKDKVAQCKTIEELKLVLIDYYFTKGAKGENSKFDNLYEDKITKGKVTLPEGQTADTVKADVLETLKAVYGLDDKATEKFKSTDTDAFKKAAYAIVDGIKKELDTQFGKISENASASYADPSAESATKLQAWLFKDERQVGDYTVISETTSTTGSDGKKTEKTTHTWYVVTEDMVFDTEKTKDAYLFQPADDTKENEDGKKLTAKEKAEAMFKALEADKTTEKFDELAKKYGMTYNSALRESITESSAKTTAEKFAEWLYAEGRKEGDIVQIVTDDKEPKYILAYFVEENEETWKVNARAGVASDKQQAWLEQAIKDYHVTVDTEAPETQAATA